MNRQEIKRYAVIGVIASAVCLFVSRFDSVTDGIMKIFSSASPLILGAIIAYVLNILLKGIEKLYFPKSKRAAVIKSRRPVGILLSFLVLGAILTLVANLVIPELVSSIRLLTDEIPGAVEQAIRWGVAHSEEIPALQERLQTINIDWQAAIKKALDFLIIGAGGVFNSVVAVLSSFFGTAAEVLVGTIFAIYLLSAKENLGNQLDRIMRAFFKPELRKQVLYVADTVHSTFTHFIVGQCTEAVLIGTLCAIGMMLLRLPYAVMTGTVVGATALIPVVGAYIGAAVGAFMVFTVNPFQALVFIVFLIILQQMEGNLIYPKVVGSSIGLPGIWVLAAVTVGGGIMGIGGMMLGVPLAASAYKLLAAEVKRRLSAEKKAA